MDCDCHKSPTNKMQVTLGHTWSPSSFFHHLVRSLNSSFSSCRWWLGRLVGWGIRSWLDDWKGWLGG